uniref:Protein kinase X-linked n=1 Tax=Eptatretus burgeri TaxID=7764 RepID=A0A8C4Q3X8_EPTBU
MASTKVALRRGLLESELREPAMEAKECARDESRTFSLDALETAATIGTGTFGRVLLVRERGGEQRWLALKKMSIADVRKLRQEQHVRNEKEALMEARHPFIVTLFWTHHDTRFLYMLMEYAPGGELFSYLRNLGHFCDSYSRFYAAEVVCALEFLHSHCIVYRDLKPENILLDSHGHIKLTDFGFSKKLREKTYTLCGTPEYLAPEVIQSQGHDTAVDWWALGILAFEMLSGHPPFFDDNPFGTYQKILACRIDFPKHIDIYARDIIRKLLVINRDRRLGNMKNGVEDVKKHVWFKNIDWSLVLDRKLTPPIEPHVVHDGDTSNFETYPNEDPKKLPPPLSEKDLEPFKDF